MGARLTDRNGDGLLEFAPPTVGTSASVHLPQSLPDAILDGQGRDAGVRFVDIDEDG